MKKITKQVISMTIAVVMVFGTALIGMDDPVYGLTFSTFTGKSPYSGVGYTTYYHNKDKFNGNVILNGVDISTYQSSGKSSLAKAKTNGVDFAIMRVTWTGYGSSGTKHEDTAFAEHYSKAKSAGLLKGVYVFSQATTTTEAKAEATYAVNRLKALNIKPSDLELPVYMDYEFAGENDGGRLVALKNKLGTSAFKTRTTECADAFCKQIKALGYTPGIYACTSFLKSSTNGSTLGKNYEIWCAQYWNACEYTGNYNIWQYSSAAKIDGIYNGDGKKTSTDVNFMYLDPNRTNSVSNDVTNCSVSGNKTIQYTGSEVKPTFTLTLGGKNLKSGTDYKIAYAKNINQGTGYAYIRGIGSYTGYKVIPFTIEKVVIENIGMSGLKTETTIYPEGEEPAVEEIAEEETPAEDVTTEPEEGTVEEGSAQESETAPGEPAPVETKPEPIVEKGYAVKITEQAQQIGYTLNDTELSGVVAGTTAGAVKKALYFAEGWEGYTFRITNADGGAEIADGTAVKTGNLLDVYQGSTRVASARIVANGTAKVTLSATSYTYDGGVKTPNITVKYGNLTVAEKITADNSLVDITYPSGRKVPGTYTVTVKSKSGIAGTVTAQYKIAVKPTTLKSVKKGGTKKIKAKWTKQGSKYITGYQLQYSRYSDMKLDLKKKVKSYKTVSATLKTNYKKKTYYVRIRTYKTVSGKTYYSSWSSKLKVKI